jgi:hypothetical protein
MAFESGIYRDFKRGQAHAQNVLDTESLPTRMVRGMDSDPVVLF